MKPSLSKQCERGFTLVELLVIIAVLALLFVMLVPRNGATRARAQRMLCVNNFKQTGLSLRVWEGDHGDKYPWKIPGTNGGTMNFTSGMTAWRHFQVLSNELSTPKVLVCPADDSRIAATNFIFLNNSNISYFIGLDASDADPQGILCGDRNITNGTPIKNGILEVTTNQAVGWTGNVHGKVGNVLLSDGSVQQVSTTGLRTAFANANTPTNHLLMPVLSP